MYRPSANAVDEATGWRILGELGAGHLITAAAGELDATFIPFVVNRDDRRILAHVARANPHWRAADGASGLLIATGAHTYVSPSLYATKQHTAEVVPTWNYTVVHAHGVVRVHEDTEWLRELVTRLTDLHESSRVDPWAVTDAPTDYVDRLLRGIIGVELRVERLEAKQKLSQNRSPEDIAGVLAGLAEGTASEQAVADDMASVVKD